MQQFKLSRKTALAKLPWPAFGTLKLVFPLRQCQTIIINGDIHLHTNATLVPTASSSSSAAAVVLSSSSSTN